jgi:hypothetical protein
MSDGWQDRQTPGRGGATHLPRLWGCERKNSVKKAGLAAWDHRFARDFSGSAGGLLLDDESETFTV